MTDRGWLEFCQTIAADVRGLLLQLPTRDDREPVIGQGKGGDVMGNPLNALAWLAEKRAAEGTPLRRGMIVMTGSMVPIQFPAAGDRAIVEVEGLGAAELVAT